MPDRPHIPDRDDAPDHDGTPVDRRARIAGQVRRWCESGSIEGRHAPLSDAAAVALAAGHLDESARAIVANRRRAGRRLPALDGFGELRRLSDDHARIRARIAGQRPGAARLALEYRANELGKRIRMARQTVVHSPLHYAQGVRAVRRDRRDGLHLEIEQREALFAALQRTPAPLPVAPVEQAREMVLGVAVDRVSRWSEHTPLAEAGRRVAERLGQERPAGDDRFVDRYDTLLFLAGSLYDRIEASAAWRSDYFEVQRAQLDLAEELTQIAVDTVALRDLLDELRAAVRSAPEARSGLESRVAALAPVWDQILARVTALARIGDLLTRAEDHLHLAHIAQRTANLDERIDDLIGRSGVRELSAENTDFVVDQLGAAAGSMVALRSALRTDIAELTGKE
ncbi:Uncharacterised protein [Rhodococcus gordoniae]|uniref:Uncharacterized protein n=1 Tax=Rhodococcus gordoniae TaxID=223392 RepID=A0A379LT48_9NOCA|nr:MULTISPECIES: hypothetical protein [Rhodococcus]SUE13217.1 Uncharacterised protein [Rhodococcus gordoniae]